MKIHSKKQFIVGIVLIITAIISLITFAIYQTKGQGVVNVLFIVGIGLIIGSFRPGKDKVEDTRDPYQEQEVLYKAMDTAQSIF